MEVIGVRRVKVAATLDTPLCEVRNSYCDQVQVPRLGVGLKVSRTAEKFLDLTQTVREARLTATAIIEAVERADVSRFVSVAICVDGEKRRAKRVDVCETTLWDLLEEEHRRKCDAESGMWMRPEFRFVRRVYRDVQEMRSKSLLDLGVVAAPMFRVSFVKSDVPMDVAMAEEEEYVAGKSVSTEKAEVLDVKMEKEVQRRMKLYLKEWDLDDKSCVKKVQENERFATIRAEDIMVQPGDAPQTRSDDEDMGEMVPDIDVAKLQTSVQFVKIGALDTSTDLDEACFDLDLADIQRMNADAKRIEQENKRSKEMLKTRDMREKEARKYYDSFGCARVRVRFPDNVVLGADFPTNACIVHLHKWLAACFKDSGLEFTLGTMRPRRLVSGDLNQSFFKCGLLPRVVLSLEWKGAVEFTAPGEYLRPDLVETLKQVIDGCPTSEPARKERAVEDRPREVCSLCTVENGALHCRECDKKFCVECWKKAHAKLETPHHVASSKKPADGEARPKPKALAPGAMPKWFMLGKKL